ncbi:MAG TPA: non-heme iron oxygenase ferredoxin subunit [Caulobacteraceae bacterium]|nr:non-heme iron oxygenase ferredoxin subunit [Caulobacteraceae bacterium]
MGWQRAASIHDVSADSGLQVQVGDVTIALFRLGDKVYALEGICPHAEAFLAEGFIDADKIECPLHQSQFEISSGKCLNPPADRDLMTYATRIEGDDILVDVG